MKRKVITKFISTLILILITFVLLCLFAENSITTKYFGYEGFFVFGNIPFMTVYGPNQLINGTFTLYSLIYLIIPAIGLLVMLLLLLFSIFKRKAFPLLSFILVGINTFLLYVICASSYYIVTRFEENMTRLINYALFTEALNDPMTIIPSLLMYVFLLFALFSILKYLGFIFRTLREAKARKLSKQEQILYEYGNFYDKDKIIQDVVFNSKPIKITFKTRPSTNNVTMGYQTQNHEQLEMVQFVNTNKAFSDKIVSNYNKKGKVIFVDEKKK